MQADGQTSQSAQARKGEGGYSLTNRVLKTSGLKPSFDTAAAKIAGSTIEFPVKVVEGSIRGSALQALFPRTGHEEGWLHRVSFNWETTTLLAGVFAKGITASR